MAGADKSPPGEPRRRGLPPALRPFGPVIGATATRDIAAGAAGAAFALLLCAALVFGARDSLPDGAFLIAPMGATAVILFALPNSPLAQPWSAVMGNTISALVALAVHLVVSDPALAVAASAGLSLTAMFLIRALHPPGGAVALTAALNPAMLDAQGLGFVVIPVFCGTLALVGLAMLWHRLNGRVYPFRQPQASGRHATADPAAGLRLGLSTGELDRILSDFRQSANLGTEDLARLIAAAERVAAGHALGAMTCGAIMSRDLVTVRGDSPAAQVADLFRKHGFTSIPVVAEGDVLLGVIFQLDLIRLAPATGPVPAADIMSRDLPKATPLTPVADLLPLLDDGGAEAVPIMAADRIVGIVTRTDLLSALARSVARGATP